MAVEHCLDAGPYQVTKFRQTPKTITCTPGVSCWGINFTVKRETAKSVRSGPEILAQWQTMSEWIDNQEVGVEAAILERVRNSSLVICSGADNVAGLKLDTEGTGD